MADFTGFQCDFCSSSFSYKKGLKRHYDKDHKGLKIPTSFYDLKEKGKPGVCLDCGSTYTNKSRHNCPSKASKGDVVVFRSRRLRNGGVLNSSSFGIKDQQLGTEEEEFRRFLCPEETMSLDGIKLSATTISKYMNILHKWIDFAKVPSLLQLPDTAGEFMKSLESTYSRDVAYKLIGYLLKFAATKGEHLTMDYQPIGHIIDFYLESPSRKETMENFGLSFFGEAEVEKARNFIMAEVLLCTKSLEFLKAMTIPTFELAKQDQDGKWRFRMESEMDSFLETSSIINILLPNDVHNLIVRYIKEIRPIFLTSSRSRQSIKIFYVGGSGNLDQVANLKGACKAIEDIAQSWVKLTLDNILSAQYIYKGTS